MGHKKRAKESCDGAEPRNGNASSPGLLGMSNEPMEMSTTNQDSYTAGRPPTTKGEGMRKQLLRKELWAQAKKEIEEEQKEGDDILETATEYNTSFAQEGFHPEPIKTDPELHRRYPLYGDYGLSLWNERFSSLPGGTRATNPKHKFRRYDGFTRPIDQPYDDTLDPK